MIVMVGLGLIAAGAESAVHSVEKTIILNTPVARLASSARAGVDQHAAFITAGPCPLVGVWRLRGHEQLLSTPGAGTCRSTPFGLSLTGWYALWGTVRVRAGREIYEVWRAGTSDFDVGPGFRGPGRPGPYQVPRRLVSRSVPRGSAAPIVMLGHTYWVDGAVVGLDGQYPIPPVRLASMGGNAVAVEAPSGAIDIILGRAFGHPALGHIEYPPGEVRAMRGDTNLGQLAVLRRGQLDLLSTRGELERMFRMPSASSYGDDNCMRPSCTLPEVRLSDFNWPYVVYVHGRVIHAIHMRTGRDVVVRRPAAAPVHAQMEAGGLTYSHGRRITYVPISKIEALFRR